VDPGSQKQDVVASSTATSPETTANHSDHGQSEPTSTPNQHSDVGPEPHQSGECPEKAYIRREYKQLSIISSFEEIDDTPPERPKKDNGLCSFLERLFLSETVGLVLGFTLCALAVIITKYFSSTPDPIRHHHSVT
jgi:hypothetical protein